MLILWILLGVLLGSIGGMWGMFIGGILGVIVGIILDIRHRIVINKHKEDTENRLQKIEKHLNFPTAATAENSSKNIDSLLQEQTKLQARLKRIEAVLELHPADSSQGERLTPNEALSPKVNSVQEPAISSAVTTKVTDITTNQTGKEVVAEATSQVAGSTLESTAKNIKESTTESVDKQITTILTAKESPPTYQTLTSPSPAPKQETVQPTTISKKPNLLSKFLRFIRCPH